MPKKDASSTPSSRYVPYPSRKTSKVHHEILIKNGRHISLHEQGVDYLRQKNLTRALAYFNAALRDNPYNIESLCYRGIVYFHQGNLSAALNDFNTALQCNHRHVQSLYFHGLIYLIERLFNRGLLYLNQKKLDLALIDFAAVLQIAPNHQNSLSLHKQTTLKLQAQERVKVFCTASISPKSPAYSSFFKHPDFDANLVTTILQFVDNPKEAINTTKFRK